MALSPMILGNISLDSISHRAQTKASETLVSRQEAKVHPL
jgi:hypothetical protein